VYGAEQRQLLPQRCWPGPFINPFIAPLPGIRKLCLRTYLVGRPVRQFPDRKFSVSIVIPCRNERQYRERHRRMPKFAPVRNPVRRGKLQRRTFEECERIAMLQDQWDIKVLKQDGRVRAMPSAGALLRRPAMS